MKKFFGILILIPLTLFLVTGCTDNSNDKNKEVIKNENVVMEGIKLDNMDISSVSISKDEEEYKITFKVSAKVKLDNNLVYLSMMNKEELITNLTGFIGSMEKDEEKQIEIITAIDLRDVDNIKYEVEHE